MEDNRQIPSPLPPDPHQGDGDAGSSFICTCQYNDGKPCSTRFLAEELKMIQSTFMEMSREEMDIVILAKLSCGMHLSQLTSCSKKKEQTVRNSQRTDFFHHGMKICRATFKYIHNIGQDKLNALIKHYKQHGITPRRHGNLKRQPPTALKRKTTST